MTVSYDYFLVNTICRLKEFCSFSHFSCSSVSSICLFLIFLPLRICPFLLVSHSPFLLLTQSSFPPQAPLSFSPCPTPPPYALLLILPPLNSRSSYSRSFFHFHFPPVFSHSLPFSFSSSYSSTFSFIFS